MPLETGYRESTGIPASDIDMLQAVPLEPVESRTNKYLLKYILRIEKLGKMMRSYFLEGIDPFLNICVNDTSWERRLASTASEDDFCRKNYVKNRELLLFSFYLAVGSKRVTRGNLPPQSSI